MKLHCLHCGIEYDNAYCPSAPDATPEDGDLSACFHCGGLSMHTVVDGVLGFRLLTDDEFKAVMADPYVVEVLAERAKVAGGW